MPERATVLTPDTVERMLALLPPSPDVHDLDAILQSAGDVLKVIEAAYAEGIATWSAQRQRLADRAIQQAFEAVNTAVLSLVVDDDIEGTIDCLTHALPALRRAWVIQMLQVV